MIRKIILTKPQTIQKTASFYSEALNEAQMEVVTKADGAALVLAGAGSGKTRTLVYRLLFLLDRGVRPENIMLVTFTNKAAHEMRHRAEKHLNQDIQNLWCGTFHHMGHRILRMYAKEAGLNPQFVIMDQDDSRRVIKQCLSSMKTHSSRVKFPQASVIQKIISLAVNTRKSIESIVLEQYDYFIPFIDELNQINKEYERRKRESDNLDFDDLIVLWIKLLKECESVREKLTNRFIHCLVDEYQDINELQNEVVELTAKKHGNLLVVGDDAQSIYSFRGAQVKNILKFPDRYPHCKIFRLESNYRSSEEIVSLANRSILNNEQQFRKKLVSLAGSHERPLCVRVRETREQAFFVADQLIELMDQGIALSDIAVLFRARYQAADLEWELSRRQIPYVLRGGVRFFEQAHIKDLCGYLRIIQNPKDAISWDRVLGFYPGIGPKTAHKLHQAYMQFILQGKSPKVLCESQWPPSTLKSAGAKLREFQSIMKGLFNLQEQNTDPESFILYLLDSNFKRMMENRYDNAKDRLDDLLELSRFARHYETVGLLLNDISLKENFKGESFDGSESSERPEQLILSTIHQAKGLEWKAVFILGLAEGQFPHHMTANNPEATEEERRLFYVAVTRAKQKLYLMHPLTRYDRQAGTVIMRTSPFIKELPEESYELAEAMTEDQFDLQEEDTIFLT